MGPPLDMINNNKSIKQEDLVNDSIASYKEDDNDIVKYKAKLTNNKNINNNNNNN